MKEVFHSKLPQSNFLKKHIAYYYFHESTKEKSVKSFIYYPHYQNGLTIYKNSEVTLEELHTTLTKPKECGYFFGYAKLINHAAKAVLHSPFNKIGIVFQPLGLNHFVKDNLATYIPNPINLSFNYFKSSMNDTLDKVYEADSIEEKVELLDSYFLKAYKGFESPKMEKAIQILLNGSVRYKVENLAQELQISRKTLLRLFKKHHNCSVVDYMRMIQFRKSIEFFKMKQSKATLTQLAHDSYYYDQSEFIKHFKKLTGFSPKHFFRDLTDLGSENTFWTFT